MYIIGYEQNKVYQYTLSKAYNLNSVVTDSRIEFYPDANITSGVFNNDGSKLFLTSYSFAFCNFLQNKYI